MAGYYVLGGISVAWALLLSAVGLSRGNFPPSQRLERALIGFGVVLALATVVVLVSSTEREHPLEEAAAEGKFKEDVQENQAAKQGADAGQAAKGAATGGGANSVPAGPRARAKAKAVPVKESEFKIAVQQTLKPGSYDFQVGNAGKIEHNLVIEDGGTEKKTPLIKGGGKSDLKVALKPGTYRFYCSVPGHAQAGMDVKVKVG
jgi:uncharacterized cupredoxin-like copper-binding protein